MKPIMDILTELEPLEPKTTGVKPRLGKEIVSAVIFDIYGTLLISSSGDVNELDLLAENLERAIVASGYRFADNGHEKRQVLDEILKAFATSVEKNHSHAISQGVKYPEVNIVEVWNAIIEASQKDGLLKAGKEADVRMLTYIFELLSNKIYPMPGMKEIVRYFREKNYPLGIVSNAQAYTPAFMNYFLNGKYMEGVDIEPFDPDLCVFSFNLQKAKPDTLLFESLTGPLKDKYGLDPEDAVFVGNDMLNDIYPAAAVGFKTVLFAGDKRSLRLREGHPLVKGLKADYVITDLQQLREIIE